MHGTTPNIEERPKVYEFTDYADFLNTFVKANGKYSHGPFNLKNWSNRLGYKSPSSLAMVLSKERLPTWKMIACFAEDFKFSKEERKYFEILVEIERKKLSGEDLGELLTEANKLSGLSTVQKVNFDHFSVVSDWYCMAIKSLVGNKNFNNDLDWIFKVLRRKVSKGQIKNAIQNLLNVGLLKKDHEKGLIENTTKIHTGHQIPSAAIRNHHRGMINQGIQAIDEQGVDHRMIQGLTLNIKKKENLKAAFQDISTFVEEFNEKYRDDYEGDAVYQLNVQLFEHTKTLQLH